MAVLALLVVAVVLLGVSAATARPPAGPLPERDGYFARWQALHGGYDPHTGNACLRGWLTLAYRLARPLARRGVLPDALTVWSLWLAVAAFVAAAGGGRGAILAGVLLVLSGLGDALDGGVAALSDRTTRWGYVLDSVVDRVAEVVYLLAVVAVGAPAWLAAVCAFGIFLLEYLRARAAGAGGSEIGAVTVGERANRVIFCAAGLLLAGVFVASAALVATLALVVLTLLTAIGLVQLGVAVRRELR